MRFHLLDRIDEIAYGKYIKGTKCVSLADDTFQEHFPGNPIFPGSLIVEGLAQLGGSFFELCMEHSGVDARFCALSMVNQFKFRRPVFPGDKLILTATVLSHRDNFGVVRAVAECDGQICAEGELTFSFLDIMDTKLRESRMELYRICTRNMKVTES